jgi:hypothetical protein
MKAASLKELKTELTNLSHSKVLELCMRLVKYKKENKELLTYLLFEANDENNYIKEVKLQMDEEFESLNMSNLYLAKKTIRKVLRTTNKYIKYSGSKQTEVELLIYFSFKIKNSGISLQSNTALGNIFQRQIIKINKALFSLHEDLQYDYKEEMKGL